MHFPFSVYSSFGLQLPSLQNFPLHFVLIEEPDRLQMCKMQAKDLCDFLFVRGEGNMEELAFFFFSSRTVVVHFDLFAVHNYNGHTHG